MQTLFKKLDKAVRNLEGKPATVDEKIQIRLTIKAIHVCTQLFPSSLKQIVSGKQLPTSQKDNVTIIIENVIKVFLA